MWVEKSFDHRSLESLTCVCVCVTVRVNNIKYIQRRSSVLDFKITLLNLGALSADTLSSAQTEMKV